MDSLLSEIAGRLTPLEAEWRDAVRLRTPHAKQQQFLDSIAKRKVIRAGRRGGKTTGIGIYAAERFMAGRRVLYTAPTNDQVQTFWWEITTAFAEPIASGALYKNETEHVIEVPGTKNRIRAKTAWNAETLRGDYADDLIFDEWQLTNEDAWEIVGAPMLLDNDGDAVFIYTPPSLHARAITKARDPQHAAKLYKKAAADNTGRWEAFHFTSLDNPHISTAALAEITSDMTKLAYEQEILAEDKDEAPGALWKRADVDTYRVDRMPAIVRLVVGVDPTGSTHNECGVVIAGLGADGHGYILDDKSLLGTPQQWATACVDAYLEWEADRIVAERNYGGDMVKSTILQVAKDKGVTIAYREVNATRGKAVRAEPIAALYEQGRVHHVGRYARLEDEMTMWVPGMGMPSPNRIDAMVWCLSDLMVKGLPQKAESFQR